MSTADRSQDDGFAIFTLRPGNIASVMNVDTPDWGEQTWIYTEKGKAPEPDPVGAVMGQRFDVLPDTVKAAIHEHFNDVFSRPVAYRGDYIRALQPKVIEVDWEPASDEPSSPEVVQSSGPRP